MVNLLVTAHALTGILSILAYLLLFIELLNPIDKNIMRIKTFTLLGTILIFISWIIGGYYYVTYYGPDVKPLIKGGSTPWVHGIIMETKEHVFLFLPFLAVLVTGMIFHYNMGLHKNHKERLSVLLLCLLIISVGLSIVGMGYLITAGVSATGVG